MPHAQALEAQTFCIRTFSNIRDPSGRPVESTLAQLAESLTRFRQAREKADVGAWAPIRTSKPGRRNDDVVELSCLVLDIDDGTPQSDLADAFECAIIWHTTWSHTPEHPKWRGIIPLATPCPAQHWRRLFAWAQRAAGNHLDPACKNEGRIYYLPASPTGEGMAAAFVDLPLLDLDYATLPETDEERRARIVRERMERSAAPRTVRPSQLPNAQRRALRENPIVRERVGHALGGHVSRTRVTGIECPSCKRPSVWWPLTPSRISSAMCNHRNSCNWIGSLEDLAEAHGKRIL